MSKQISITSRLVFLLSIASASSLIFILSGCAGAPQLLSGPSPEQVKIDNLETSVELVRDALREVSDERDRFQEGYLNTKVELRQQADDSSSLEAQLRFQLNKNRKQMQLAERLREKNELTSESLSQAQQVINNLQDQRGRTRGRLDGAHKERDQLQQELAEANSELSKFRTDYSKAIKERDSLRYKLRTHEQVHREGTVASDEQLASKSKTLTALQSELTLLRPLRKQVKQLQLDLRAAVQAKEGTLARLQGVEAKLSATAQPLSASSSSELVPVVTAFSRDSIAKIQRGDIDREVALFVGVVAGFSLLLLLSLVGLWRAGSWKRRYGFAAAQLESAAAAVAVNAQLENSEAKRISVPQKFQQSAPPVTGSQFEVAMPSEDATQMLQVQSNSSEQPWNHAVTEDLSALNPEAPVPPLPTPASNEDDKLLSDLREVIDKKFN